MMKQMVEDPSNNTNSNINSFSHDENSSKSLAKIKNAEMIKSVYRLMMNQDV